MKFQILLFIFISICHFSAALFGYTFKYNTHAEPQISTLPRAGTFAPAQKFIEQSLDNFNPQDDRRWQMRYYENNAYFQPGGPIFIYLGGEWTISSGAVTGGTLMVEMAQEMNGMLFYTEHRYYGQSRPTANTTTENLQYLSIDQAMADVAHFIDVIKDSSSDFRNSSVVLVGASYSATMAAWMRKKYPHLIAGAFASSGPVNAQIDFYEYKEVMSRSILRVGGQNCSNIIENAFADMERLVEEGNTTRITQAFNLCQPLQDPNDIPHFFYEISDVVAGLVQAHRPGNIQSACSYMESQRNTVEDIEAFAAWILRGSSGCMDFSYANHVEKFNNVTWGSEANRQMRQWTYQTCSEFAWYQTSTSVNQIFGTKYPVDYFFRICNDFYNNSFSEEIVAYNVRRTNIRFGGFYPSLTNVVFTNGDLDPWHPMSILSDVNEDAPSILIPYAAHVSDLGQTSVSDSPEMRESKLRVKQHVRKWVGILNYEDNFLFHDEFEF